MEIQESLSSAPRLPLLKKESSVQSQDRGMQTLFEEASKPEKSPGKQAEKAKSELRKSVPKPPVMMAPAVSKEAKKEPSKEMKQLQDALRGQVKEMKEKLAKKDSEVTTLK